MISRRFGNAVRVEADGIGKPGHLGWDCDWEGKDASQARQTRRKDQEMDQKIDEKAH